MPVEVYGSSGNCNNLRRHFFTMPRGRHLGVSFLTTWSAFSVDAGTCADIQAGTDASVLFDSGGDRVGLLMGEIVELMTLPSRSC
jgi:hypothetical protein